MYVYKGKKFNVKIAEYTVPSGRRVIREVVEYRGAVAIIPVLPNGNILLIEEYRPVVGEWLIEVPAGTLEEGEDPKECALRELEEETGYKAGKLELLFTMYIAPGYSTELMYVFEASQLKKSVQKLEPYEVIRLREAPLREAVDLAVSGRIKDAKTIAAILVYAARKGLLTCTD